MSVGAAFLLHVLIVALVVLAILLVLLWIASLVWLLRVVRKDTAGSGRRPKSTLDQLEEELSRLDRLDGMGRELR